MLIPITIALLCASPPETRAPVDAPRSFVDLAHERLAAGVRSTLISNLRSYAALSATLGEQLTAADSALEAIDTLDSLRKTGWAAGLENTVPGFPWLLKTFDRLRALSDRLELVKERMSRLEKTAGELLTATKRYADAPGTEHFRSLMRGFEDAEATFAEAEKAFADIDAFIAGVLGGLTKAGATIDRISALPFLGEYAAPLRDDVVALTGRLQLVRGVVGITTKAITRDRDAVKTLRDTMNEARAHDAYEAARADADRGRPGSALSAFREVRARWPDTQWAHRADRRIVTLVAHIDRLEAELAQSRLTIAALRAESATRERLARDQNRRIDIANAAAAAPLRPPQSPLWPWLLGGTAALVGLVTIIWRQQRAMRD